MGGCRYHAVIGTQLNGVPRQVGKATQPVVQNGNGRAICAHYLFRLTIHALNLQLHIGVLNPVYIPNLVAADLALNLLPLLPLIHLALAHISAQLIAPFFSAFVCGLRSP